MEDKKLEYYKMHQNIPWTHMYVKFVEKVLFTIVEKNTVRMMLLKTYAMLMMQLMWSRWRG